MKADVGAPTRVVSELDGSLQVTLRPDLVEEAGGSLLAEGSCERDHDVVLDPATDPAVDVELRPEPFANGGDVTRPRVFSSLSIDTRVNRWCRK